MTIYNLILPSILFFTVVTGYAQLKGIIINYANQPLTIYRCYGDTLFLYDSTYTNKKGEFTFSDESILIRKAHDRKVNAGLYKIVLQRNQWFYILNDNMSAEIKTLYQPNAFYNIATDSLVVIKSEENRRFYEFQRIQMQINVAHYWLLQMLRLYPLPDPFHKQIEDEYFKRYAAMERFVKDLSGFQNLTGLVAKAYYQPLNPDWKQPDPWRDSIIASHYFEYFNPEDSFYLYTNILTEKIDLYLSMRTNKRDAYGRPVNDENLITTAAQDFLEKVKPNRQNFEFCLNYLLKKFNKEHKENAFLQLYDNYIKPLPGDCETSVFVSETLKEKAAQLKNVAMGSVAPDFEIEKGKLSLSSLQSDYTLLLFWATWCPHCAAEIPRIKETVNNFNSMVTDKSKMMLTVAVSLDSNMVQWQNFIKKNNLFTFLNFSELKGWNGEVSKKYNVYATPTMFLLDKDKKIIAKPETVDQVAVLLN